MEQYSVKLMARARRDLDGIYAYIAKTLLEPGTAMSLVEKIEGQILSLSTMPYRCPERKRGAYANRGYRWWGIIPPFIGLMRLKSRSLW